MDSEIDAKISRRRQAPIQMIFLSIVLYTKMYMPSTLKSSSCARLHEGPQTPISALKPEQYFMLRSRPPIALEIDKAIMRLLNELRSSLPLTIDEICYEVEGLLKDLYGNCEIDVYVGDSEPPCRSPKEWLRARRFEKLSIMCSCEVSRRRVDCYEVVLWGVEKRGDLILSFGGVDVKYSREVVEA